MNNWNPVLLQLTRWEQLVRCALLVVMVVLPWPARGQLQPRPVWFSTNGGDGVVTKAMTQDRTGNLLIGGVEGGDYLTMKYDANGNLLWKERMQARLGNYSGLNAIAVDDGGNVYITGGLVASRSYTVTICDFFSGCHDYRFYASDQVTIKYNSTGQRQWTATYFERGDRAFVGNAIVVDAQGSVYVAGTATVKYDNAGRQLWLNTNLVTTAVTLDKSGQVCLTGLGGTHKLDPNGNVIWTSPVGGTVMKVDDAGALYLGGLTTTTKLDAHGKTIWTSPLGAYDLALDPSGHVYVTGARVLEAGGLAGPGFGDAGDGCSAAEAGSAAPRAAIPRARKARRLPMFFRPLAPCIVRLEYAPREGRP